MAAWRRYALRIEEYFDWFYPNAWRAHQQLCTLVAQTGIEMHRVADAVHADARASDRMRLRSIEDIGDELRLEIVEAHLKTSPEGDKSPTWRNFRAPQEPQ